MFASTPDALLGTTLLGRYTVRKLLGEGSMGKVYLGEQRIGDGVRQVAIKVLASPRGNDDYIIARFRREATTIASLEHPNIIKLYDYGEENGYFVSVMEFVPGGSLADLIARERVDPARGEAIAWQIARALQVAHDRGIVHRDLKPENVLLAPAQDGLGVPVVKVVDFGIARRPPQKPGERALTMTGTMLGTPAFMAPEQFSGGDVDRRADVYALSLVIYQMFSGVLPWPARSIPEWMEAHLNLVPTPLRGQPGCAHLPPRYDLALGQGLEKDASRRPPTTVALLQSLTGDGAPDVVPEQASPNVRVVSNPNLAATVVGPPPASSVLPTLGSVRPVSVPDRRPVVFVLLALAALVSLGGGYLLMRGYLRSEPERQVVDGQEIPSIPTNANNRPDVAPQHPPPSIQPLPPDPLAARNAAAQQRIREILRVGLQQATEDHFVEALASLEQAHGVMRETGASVNANEFEALRQKVEQMAPRGVRDVLSNSCRSALELQARLELVQAGAQSARLFGASCPRETSPDGSTVPAMEAPPRVVSNHHHEHIEPHVAAPSTSRHTTTVRHPSPPTTTRTLRAVPSTSSRSHPVSRTVAHPVAAPAAASRNRHTPR